MPKQKFMQTFTGGMQGDVPSEAIPMDSIRTCKNFLIEYGILKNRPGAKDFASAEVNGAGEYIDSFMWYSESICRQPMCYGSWHNAQSDGLVRIFKNTNNIMNNGSVTGFGELVLTLPAGQKGGFYLKAAAFNQKTYVMGTIDSGNNLEVLEIDNFTNTVTAHNLPGSNVELRGRPFIVFAHLSRLFYVDPGGGSSGSIVPTVYWSKIGDATVWTGHFTAGNVQLAEADDGVVAGGVCKNLIVLARPSGFHIGSPTGNAELPYDWKAINKAGIGCAYPESFVIWGDLIFFCGTADVYQYDLSGLTAIGEGITAQLFALTTLYGMTIRAFVTESYANKHRPQLHLLPTFAPSTYRQAGGSVDPPELDLTILPHFVYDILEKKWTTHIYDAAADDDYPLEGVPLYMASPNPNTTLQMILNHRVGLVRRTATGAAYMIWDGLAEPECESVAQFVTGQIDFGDPTVEHKICRMLFMVRTSADNQNFTVSITYEQGNTFQSTGDMTVNVPDGGPWQRVWLNKILVGNFFEMTVTCPAGVQWLFKSVLFEVDSGQEVRT
jgi:hypothetical protein